MEEYVDGQQYEDGVPVKEKYEGYRDLGSHTTIIDPISDIYNFNHKAGLVCNGYNDSLEDSMAIEESLENWSDITSIYPGASIAGVKDVSRAIIDDSGIFTGNNVERLDKCCDRAILAIGGMAKLGLDPTQITKALNIVMRANYTKLGNKLDEKGKLIKQEGFEGPEGELQKLLDEVSGDSDDR